MQKCKKCDCDVFKALVYVPAALTINETGKPEIKQYFEDNIKIDKLMCVNCEAEYDISEFESKQCKRCNNVFLPNELNEDGLCTVCEAIETRFKDVSLDDMVRKSLDLEKELADIKNQMLELSRLVKENQSETKKKTTKKSTRTSKKAKSTEKVDNKTEDKKENVQVLIGNNQSNQEEEVLEEVAVNKTEPAWTESIKDVENQEFNIDDDVQEEQNTDLKTLFNNSTTNNNTLDFGNEYDDDEPF